MSRWTVYKAGRYAWTAHKVGDLPGELFHTWRDAMDYADRMARTREYVLPRVAPHPSYGYIVHPEDPWVYSWPNGRWHLAPIGDWDAHAALLCNDVGEYKIHADELRPLALALLALAEQENA